MEGANGETLNAIVWTFMSTSLVLVMLRLVSRMYLTKFAGVDDIFIAFAILIDLGFTICTSVAVTQGFGTHASELTAAQLMNTERSLLVLRAMSPWMVAVPKLSVAAILVRVFSPRRWLTITFYGMAAFGVVLAAIATILWVVQCDPVQAMWDHSITDANCWPPAVANDFGLFQFVQSVVWDFVYAIYPMLVLARLQMSRWRKIGLGFNMGLGILAGIVGLYKCATLPALGLAQITDPTYLDPIGTIWVSAEGNLLVIAACIPTIGPVFKRCRDLATGASKNGTTGITAGSSNKYVVPASKRSYRGGEGDDVALTQPRETRSREGSDIMMDEGIGRSSTWRLDKGVGTRTFYIEPGSEYGSV